MCCRISFVDDTDSITLSKPNETWDQLKNRAQEGLNMWECLIRTTGGAIEPSKSFWVPIQPILDKHGHTKLSRTPKESLYITGLNGDREELEQKKEDEANLGLGVWQAPSGQEETQTKQLMSKIKEWNNKVCQFPTKHAEGRSMLNMTIGRKLRYPLAATALSEEQCEKITKYFTWAALGKAGVVRTASREVVNAPTIMGGMNMKTNIEEMQLIDHIKMLICHGHRFTVTGQLIRVAAECISVEAGVIEDPMNLNDHELSWVTKDTWIRRTIEMLNKHEIKIQTSLPQLNTWANEDESLMDNIQEHNEINWIKFNRVRMFLKVVTLSDICTADFKFVDRNMYEAVNIVTTVNPSRYAYNWPSIKEIDDEDRNNWKQGIKHIFKIDGRLRLQQTCMRDWDKQNVTYFCWSLTNEETILQRTGSSKWVVWEPIINAMRYITRASKKYRRTNRTVTKCEENSTPITIRFFDTQQIEIINVGNSRHQYNRETKHWLIPTFSNNDWDVQQFVDLIKNKEGRLVINNPDSPGIIAAFAVYNTNINAVIPTQGAPSCYRQVLVGILSAVYFVNQLSKSYEFNEGMCYVGTSCLGALTAALGNKQPTINWKEYEIIDAIKTQLGISKIKWRMIHIKSEINNKWKQTSEELLKNYKTIFPKNNEIGTSLILGEKWRIVNFKINNETLENDIREHLYENKMKKRWKQRLKLEQWEFDETSWDNFRQINKRNKAWKKIFISKYNSGILGTMKNLKRRKHSEIDKCPNCGAVETETHIFKCPAVIISDEYELQMENLSQLLKTTTSVHIQEGIKKLLNHFRQSERIEFTTGFPEEIKKIVRQQASLGLKATLGGFWHKEWIVYQKEYYKRFKLRYSAKAWLANTVSSIQDILFNLWIARNNNLHHKEDSLFSIMEVQKLDKEIEVIFNKIPHSRLLSRDGRRFFNTKIEYVKRFKRRNKAKWIKGANQILDRYYKEMSGQSRKFISYFAPN